MLDPARVLVVVTERRDSSGDLRRFFSDRPAIVFDSVDAFEVWRERSRPADTIAPDVDLALAEMCCDRRTLPRVIACALDTLAAREAVPKVCALVPPQIGERTFYRRWIACMPRRPKQFLARVRLLHAVRLIDSGLDPQEAAFRAGYNSHGQFRKALTR